MSIEEKADNKSMNLEEKADIKCGKCKCYRYPSEFLNTRGRTLKTCKKCRDLNTKSRERCKCPHGKRKSQCKECTESKTQVKTE